MPMFNLKEYSDNYSNTTERLWQYYKDELNNNFQILNHLNLN